MIAWPRTRAVLAATAIQICAIAIPNPAPAEAPYPALTLLAGFAPGGGDGQGGSVRRSGQTSLRPQPVYDLAARLYVRHLGRFLPGSPKVILRHMPGGGGLAAASYLLNKAPRDGTGLGIFQGYALRAMLLAGRASARSAAGFTAVGGLAFGEYVCAARARTDKQKPLILAATAPRERTYLHARAFAAASGRQLTIITGYANSAQAALAFRRGEADGLCGLSLVEIRSQLGDAMAQGSIVPLMRFAPANAGNLPQVRRASELIAGETAGQPSRNILREALEFLDWQGAVDWALLAPPSVPPARAEILRRAYSAMLSDPQFRRDAVRWGLTVDPVAASRITAALHAMAAISPPAASLVRQWSRPENRKTGVQGGRTR